MNKLSAITLLSLILILSISFASASDIDSIDLDESAGASEVDELEIDENTEELSAQNVIYISPDGTGSGSSSQDPTNWNNALSKASSGDTIQFANGNYTGINNVHQTISQSITLKGSGNSIIDAQQNGGFFTIGPRASVTLQNLSLINAYTGKHYDGPDGADAPFDGEGGIINNGKLTIIDCLFDYNKGFGTEGGSIRNNGECNVYNTKFSRNSGAKGASIYCEKNAILNIDNCTFTGGFSKKGNDIYADEKAVVTIRNSTMGNAYGKSGLIVIKKSKLYMYDTFVSGARSIDTAGVVNIDKESTVEIYGCTFEKNSATGGTLLFNEKNEPGEGDGGAIVVEKDATNVIIKDCIFKDNYAKNRGGAIYIESSTSITIDNCTFEGNTAGYGNNIYSYKYASSLNIKNCNIEVVSEIQTSDIEYGETEIINVKVDDGTNNLLNPTYSIFTNNQEYDLRSGSLSLYNLKVGNYTAVLIGRDSNSNTYTFTQPSSLFIIGGEELEATVSYSFNDDGSMNIVVIDEYDRPVANKEIIVIIDNETYKAVTDSKGIAQIAPELQAGNHSIRFEVKGKIISNSTPSVIEVENNTSAAQVDEVSVSYSYNDDGTINVLVKDKYSRVVENTEVKLTINGVTYISTTNANGVAVINPDKNVVGEYDVQVEVTGRNVTSQSSQKIKVMPATGKSSIVAQNITRAQNSAYDFKARFLDKNSNPLKNKTVMFVYNGNEYEVMTDEFGYATFKNSLLPGNYQITSFNPATNEQVTNNVTITARINSNKNINMDYATSATYTVRVYGDNGQVVGAGEKVVFKIDGKNAKTVLTDANGYAKFVIQNNNLLPKTHTVTAEYKGSAVSNNLVVKQVLKASNKKYKRYKLKTYTATLKTSKGKPIKAKQVTFKFNGKTYKAKTDKNGVAKITIKKFWKVGKFKITVKYLKNSIKKTITIKR